MRSRRFTSLMALVPLALCTAVRSYAQSDSPECNNELIRGDYGFRLQGIKLAGPTGTPVGSQMGVAMTQFDGKGNLTQIDSVTIGGVSVSDFTHTPATGTYKVNADCTGTFTIVFTDGRPTVVTDFVVAADGDEIDTVVKSAGDAQGILATGSVGRRRSRMRP
jgi:hypothetical protein